VQRFQNLLRDSIVQFASGHGANSPEKAVNMKVRLRLHAQFMASATMSVLAWWLEEGQPFTPHQMAGYLVQPHSA
jgi:hypothetical protein